MDSCNNQYDGVRQIPGFAGYNGIVITHVADGRAEGALTITPSSLNPRGHVHGGCLVSLADTVAGTAAHSLGRGWVTLSAAFNYFRPGVGTRLICRAEPQKVGRTVAVYDTTLTDDQERLVATGCFTFYCVEQQGPGPGH